MELTYEINDNYGVDFEYSYLNGVIKRTLEHENALNSVFSIIFVGNEEIQKINKEYRGLDKVTDVISFAFEDNNDLMYNDIRVLGDIYICIPRMLEQASEYGHGVKRELSFLTVHGLLHLLGYDHMTSDDEKVMFGLQEWILNEEGIKK